MLSSNRTKVGVREDQEKHRDVVSWNQCFKIYFAGRMMGFLTDNNPYSHTSYKEKYWDKGVFVL